MSNYWITNSNEPVGTITAKKFIYNSANTANSIKEVAKSKRIMETTVLADTTNTVEEVAKSKLAGAETETQKRNVIHVSNTKKPLYFYLNLAKKFIKQHNEIQLSALGMAIPTVVIIAEILKSNGLAIEKKVLTSLVSSEEDSGSRLIRKAKIVIVLERKDKVKVNTDTVADENAATKPKDADDN